MNPHFKIKSKDKNSSARLGKIHTAHGVIETPVFAPVGSQGTIKALTHAQVEELGAQIMLVNAYHLYLRPGLETIRAHEGVHAFMSWKKPILSDSGGFQIYSLSPLAKVKSDGVQFASHLDGTKIFVTPEDVIDIQLTLGTDILMPLDYFVPYPSENTQLKKAVELTTRWAQRSREHFLKHQSAQQHWGICQGGVERDLRHQSITELTEIDFDGYALGGLGIGEPKTQFMDIVQSSCKILPETNPVTSWA